MTLLSWKRAWSLLVVVAALASCAGPPEPDARDNELDALRAAAREATERVVDLEERLIALEQGAVRAHRKRAALRRALERRDDRLEKVVVRLRSSLGEVRSSASSAADDTESALAAASEAARGLAVLTRRFDYHLRSSNRG